ncbi:TPA: restriction endonuclease subunit M [Vibrio cholerae]|uniref:restriction endonuclease subunit M n=1 Tax=Vibrio cholerae TaxID=666 RepID=UPI00157A4F36|nr:N-6 DNA methylase [Vibrio cholerae]
MKNLFCSLADLKNEAAVESYFMDRLLTHLGYADEDIKLKTSISEYEVGKGSKKSLYKPDYVVLSSGVPTIVIDAKSTTENITDWESQCSSYSLEINKEFDYNPVEYYILSNGIKTSLYQWDKKKPILEMDFDDFLDGNEKLLELERLISKSSLSELSENLREELAYSPFKFEKVSLDELASKFQKIHQEIWQSEKKGPSAAFQELIKIFFVKIRKDREIHLKLGGNPKPKYKDVIFSQNWIASQTETKNPINQILFRNLVSELEKDIMSGKKKRFFEENDQINISYATMKKVVKEIENIDLYGMEEDIHGRMFETFLDATIRGKDIGQFFTPRDVVDLMVEIGNPKATKTKVTKVLDACCGSGGFLIASLSKMLKDISQLKGLSRQDKEALDNVVKTQSIYGIDAGSDPSMYKIARMNMYLHGDGGSNIYYADSLDKGIGRIGSENLEVDQQIEELRKMVLEEGVKFDLILSNPPFSLQYTRENKEQSKILNQYSLSRDRAGGKLINKLISSVMFIERYKDLITDDGHIVAVIDDSVLSGESYKYVRNYIRDNFIIEAVISLPGDAFRRAAARVKTSVIVLKKKKEGDEQQDVFMMSSIYLGVEKKTAKRIGIDYRNLSALKEKEKKEISDSFKKYQNGIDGSYVIPFENCLDRLDVKYCINDRGRKAPEWNAKGYKTDELGNILKLATKRSVSVEDLNQYQLLVVNYDGEINDGEILDGAESSYSKLYKVKTWDILISNMGFGRGAVSVVPPHHNGKYVSNEYTILNAPSKEHAVFYWNLLRTKEILGDVFSSTTGMNRGRIKWDIIKTVLVPIYDDNEEIKKLTEEIESFWVAFANFTNSKKVHVERVAKELEVSGDDSFNRWLSFKPPE